MCVCVFWPLVLCRLGGLDVYLESERARARERERERERDSTPKCRPRKERVTGRGNFDKTLEEHLEM